MIDNDLDNLYHMVPGVGDIHAPHQGEALPVTEPMDLEADLSVEDTP